jgi:hypothetical protein
MARLAAVAYFGSVEVSIVDLCCFLVPVTFVLSAGDVVRPATLVRLRGLGPETLSMILDRTTGLTILLLS